MASLIANCLARLVRNGKITQRAADAAQALHDGMQGRLGQTMGPTHADAAAALEAARAMAAAARRRKVEAAQKAIRLAEGQERLAIHPRGKSAGLTAMVTGDIWQAPTPGVSKLDVESMTEVVEGRLFGIANDFLEKYESKAAGFKQDLVGIRNVVRERFGENTGDVAAQRAWQSWSGAVEAGVAWYKRAGGHLSVLDDWGLPQHWDSPAMRRNRAKFMPKVDAALARGGLTIMDPQTGAAATTIRAQIIAQKAAEDIALGRHSAASGKGFDARMRVFRFNDADTYLEFSDMFMAGQGGLYGMMAGHLHGMAREISLTEVFGPDHPAIFNALHQEALAAPPGTGPGTQGGVVARKLTGPRMAQLAYMDQTGQLAAPQSEWFAGLMGGLRNIKSASSFGSAIASAFPGDAVTLAWAARLNGIPAGKVLTRWLGTTFADTAEKRAHAARLNIAAHSWMSSESSTKRFHDQVAGDGRTARIASKVIRASGLQAETEAGKRVFAMEYLGTIADQTRFAWNTLNPDFRTTLQRHGFADADWETMRATPLIEIEEGGGLATYFDPQAAGRLGDRIMSMIIDQRHYGIIEPRALTRAIVSGGQRRGTFGGEFARSAFWGKGFSVTFAIMHLTRTFAEGPIHSRVWRFAKLISAMTIAGAFSIQAKQIISGKDPRDMTAGEFWWAALAQGGGLGIYGDFLNSAVSRGGQGFWATAAGPILGEIPSTIDFIGTLLNPAPGGKQRGEALAQYLRRWTPGSTLWYARLAADRYIFDFIQKMIDPDAAGAFRRQARAMQQDYGQRFWWSPGASAPSRGPDMGAALPN